MASPFRRRLLALFGQVRRHPLAAAVAAAVIVNVLFGGLYVWSQGGQTAVVEVQSENGFYRVLVDGRVVFGFEDEAPGPKGLHLDAPASGVVTVSLPKSVSSLPEPGGIDSIVLLDPQGRELFRDDFEFLDLDTWLVESGALSVKDGVLRGEKTDQANTLRLRGEGWRDYTVRVTYRNNRGGTIGTHVTGDGGAFYHFELIRDLPNFFDVFKDGERTGMVFGGWVHTDPGQSTRSLAAMLTRPYPYILLGLLAGLALTVFVGAVWRLGTRKKAVFTPRFPAGALSLGAAALIAAAAFGLAVYINRDYYGSVPHVPDEVSYIFQAKLFAAGRIVTDIPPVKEAFYFYVPNFMYEHGEKWASIYPFGHPLILAIGEIVGALDLIPPLVGAATVLLTFAVGRRLYGLRTGLLAALFLAGSPFFLMQASGYMSHNTGAFYIMACLFCLLRPSRPQVFGFAAGLLFGLGANTRPLNMAALAPLLALLLLLPLLRPPERAFSVRRLAAFLAGGAIMLLAMLLYNGAVTGDVLQTPYMNESADPLGFTNGYTFDIGLRNQQAQLMALGLVFNGLPAYLSLALPLVPFLLGSRNRWDYFCLACVLLPVSAYILYRFSGVYAGPRYWYETMPFLTLLAARGAETAGVFLAGFASSFLEKLAPATAPRPLLPQAAGVFVASLAALALLVWGSGSWLFGWRPHEDAVSIPTRLDELEAIFEVDSRLADLADRTPLDNALVLVKPCGFFASGHCYGSVFVRNSVDFQGRVVWARYVEGRNQEIISAFPGRKVYVATWDGQASIDPYDPVLDR